MKETDRPEPYFSGLLRLRRVGGDGSPIWRCSLEIPGTGEVLSFPDLAGLVTYLEARTDSSVSKALTPDQPPGHPD